MLRLWFLALLLLGCGVEAGNPGGGTKKGALSISVAREPKAGNQQLTLALQEIQLIASQQDSAMQGFKPQKTEFSLFGDSSQGDSVDSQDLGATEIEVGDYSQIVFQLMQENPIRYFDRDGVAKKIRWEDPHANSFALSYPFTIKEGEKTEVLLNMNPYQSVVDGPANEGSVFRPRGEGRKRDLGEPITGAAPITDAQWICVYLYNPEPRPPTVPFKGSSRGPRMEDRPVFASKEMVVLDESTPCKNAFSQAPVVNSNFRLRGLPPGSYLARYFRDNQTFVDGSEIQVTSNHSKSLRESLKMPGVEFR